MALGCQRFRRVGLASLELKCPDVLDQGLVFRTSRCLGVARNSGEIYPGTLTVSLS